MRTYSFSIWDHNHDCWEIVASGLALFALRPLVREYRQHWDDCSLLVCCEQEFKPDTTPNPMAIRRAS